MPYFLISQSFPHFRMQKKFIVNLLILLFLNLLIKPFWILIIEPHVQNTVGNGAFGEYYSIAAFSFLLNILLDFGITNFNNKNIAQNNHLLAKHFSGLFVLKLILAGIYILATVIVGLVIGYDIRLTKLLLILGFNQFLISMVLYLRSNLQALHFFKTDALLSVLDRVIMITIVSMMLWTNVFGGRMDIMDFVYAQTVGYFLTAVIAFFAVISNTKMMRMKWNLPFSLMILKKSYPFAVLVLLMTFYNRIDSVMLERLLPSGNEAQTERLKVLRDPALKQNEQEKQERLALEKTLEHTGPEQAGIYAKAFRMLEATNMIAYLFSVLLIPMFSRMIKYKESVEQLVKLSFTLLMTVAVVVAIGSVFYRNEIMAMLYGKEHLGAVTTVFPLLMSCFVAISTTYVFGSLLTANGNLRELNIMAFCGMIINVTLNLMFIEVFHMDAIGTAIASLTTQMVTALAQVLIVRKIFKFRVNYRLLTTLLVYTAGVVALANVAHTYLLRPATSTGWVLGFLIMAATSLAWAFAIRLISIKGMFRIMKYG
jgi:O-antigen/teichoic acid export membrane protein